MNEYKILTQNPEKKIIGSIDFDYEKMEKSLNEYGGKGYKLINFNVYSMGLGSVRFIAIFEKC
jgi:hypothetical protein